MTLGESIRLHRKRKGLTQKKLAELAGLSTGAIQQYETNKRQPKYEIVKRIAEIIDMSIVTVSRGRYMDPYIMPQVITEDADEHDYGILCICAIRYCHGRETYIPSLVRSIVTTNINRINNKHLNVMIDDCDYQRRMNLYGDERIDKQGWLDWENYLLEERKRRMTKKELKENDT